MITNKKKEKQIEMDDVIGESESYEHYSLSNKRVHTVSSQWHSLSQMASGVTNIKVI